MADMDLDDLDSSTNLADASEIAAAHAAGRRGKEGGDSSDEGEEDDYIQDEELQVGVESRKYDAVWLVRVPDELFTQLANSRERGKEVEFGKLRVRTGPDGEYIYEIVPPPPPPSTTDSQPIAGPSSSSSNNNNHAQNQPETIYELVEAGVPEKTVKWAYLEDERRVFYNGKSKERARPRLVKKITKEGILKPKLSIAGQAESLRMAMRREEAKKGKARMLDEYNMTLAEQNQLAAGGVRPSKLAIAQTSSRAGPSSTSKSTTSASTSTKKEKTYRISDSRLKDFLFEEFARYKYWPLKALVERLAQPTEHVRTQLAVIAEAVTVGPYKGNWTLKPQYADDMDVSDTEELAPEEQDFSEAVAELIELAEAGAEVEDDLEKERKLREKARLAATGTRGEGNVKREEEGAGAGAEPVTSEAGGEGDYGDDDDDDDDEMEEV